MAGHGLVTDGLLRTARATPERAAIVRGDVSRGDAPLTYAALAARVEAVAAGVRAEVGDPRGRVVALTFDGALDAVEGLVAFLGVAHAGAIAAPLSETWPAAQRRRALERCEAALHLAQPGDLARLERAGAGGAPARPGVDGAAPFYAGFTSGSTREPRAIVRSHEAWVRSFEAMSVEFGIEAGMRVLVPGSMVFSFSLIAALQALAVGGTLLLPARPGVRGLLEALAGDCDAVHVLPSTLHEALMLAERRGRSLPAVGQIVCAGEPLPPGTRELVARRCPGARLFEYYGASELGFVTVLDPEGARSHPGSVGRAFHGSAVAVLDDAGQPAPPGAVGLLCARTPYGGTHELGGPSLEAALDHHGWRTVGDLARMDPDGTVTLAGRRDRMAVIRGENVYPEAVEAAIAALPAVARAAVAPWPPGRPTHLVAVAEAATAGVTAAAILDACRAALPPRERPRRVRLVASMPLTAAGKIDHAAVARLIATR